MQVCYTWAVIHCIFWQGPLSIFFQLNCIRNTVVKRHNIIQGISSIVFFDLNYLYFWLAFYRLFKKGERLLEMIILLLSEKVQVS